MSPRLMVDETSFVVSGTEAGGRVAVLHEPAVPARRGVLIVVGGPQYRVGSHRQFVLLARTLAAEGSPVMRFDCRGMGDSAGELAQFTRVEEDIRTAIDAFCSRIPGMHEVVLWGLCDAASASLFYAWSDSRVGGLVLVNPWIRTDEGQARAYVRHYYLYRVASTEFWWKILSGRFNLVASLSGLIRNVRRSIFARRAAGAQSGVSAQSLPERMAGGMARFRGQVLVILSGDDLTAAEFRDTVKSSNRWRQLMRDSRVKWCEMEGADHTFSRREWRERVAGWTRTWLESF